MNDQENEPWFRISHSINDHINLGPIVQSIVSLKTSLRHQLVK